MSFTFGGAATTTGSTFGTTPATGFAFGAGDTKPFGGTTNTPDNKAGAFNFTSPTTQAQGQTGLFGGGFAFGGAKSTAPTSSLFASPTSTTGQAFGAAKPMGFNAPPNQTVGSPGFGQPTQNQSTPFGMAPQQSNTQQGAPPAFGTPPSTGFGFGKAAPQATPTGFGFSTPASGFSAAAPAAATTAAPAFGASSFAATPGALSFGGTPTATSAPAAAFGSQATAAPAGNMSFGSAMSFGGQTAQPTGGLSFGTTATSTAPTTSQAGGLSFGSQPTQQTSLNFTTATSSTGLGFAQPTSQPSAGLFGAQPTSQPSQGLSFGAQPATQPNTSLSFGAQPTSQSNTGLSFGQPTAQPAGLSFGGQPNSSGALALTGQSGLNFSQPAAGVPASAAPATSATSQLASFSTPSAIQPAVSFGAPTSAAKPAIAAIPFGTTAAPTVPTTGLSFGAPSSTAASTGLSFGAPSSTAPQTGLSFGAPSSTAASTGLNFGATSASSAPTASLSFGTTPASSAAPVSTGLGFGAKLATSSTAATSSAASGIVALVRSTAATTMPSLTTATTVTAAPLVPPQQITSITFAELQENINKWTLELEEQEKTFINQATQINAWDRLLIANGAKIVELNEVVQTVKNEQQSLEHELDFVLAQQKELEELLAPMEKQLNETSGDRVRDPEREQMYTLAENLDSQLKQMSEDLKEVIEHLNETNRSQDSNDPIVQIGRILNTHMSSMQWIDNSIAQISNKLDQLKATHDTLRRDNERSFQLTYN